jgi:outer membrane protein insertion porin family
MYKIVFRKVLIVTLLLCVLSYSKHLFADTNVKIAILPFSLDALKSNEQLKNKIPLILSKQLESEGAKVIIPEIEDNIDDKNFNQIRNFGIKTGVDYILTGSIFLAGQSISIDSKLINIYENQISTSIYTNADNLENLYSAITQLSKEIIGELFQQQIIIDISVSGNKRVESDAIIRIIETQTGDVMKSEKISKDLRKIYEMGYFDNIEVEKQSLDNGVKLIFNVTEKATVRKIKFTGNSVYEDDELTELVKTRTGSILNIHKLNSDVNQMRMMYTEKNYHNCSVTYEIKALEHSQADIIFSFKEGDKIRVEKITFDGNSHFSDKKIKKVMETSEKGFFSFITSSGDLKEIEVQNDAIRIESLYKNSGFIDAKVSDPEIVIGEDSITIHFNIKEGSQYKIKKIDVTGDLILTKEEIFESIQSKENELYNRENISQDIHAISDIYSDKGFANVNVSPVVDKNESDNMMIITYAIDQGEPVYFDRINISGNLKTRDKVIRREIKIVEQDLYSKTNIQKSYKNLNRLDYFANIDVQPVKTSKENRMDLDVKIVEKDTGNLSFGGGISSADGPFVSGSVQERNLFGKGQSLQFEAKFSSESVSYNISFFEPYIMDSNISGGVQVYKEDKEYDYYDKESIGLTLKLGYRLFDYTRIGINYNIENYEITNAQTANTLMTPGSFLTTSIKPYIQYDSRDAIFLPTEGSKHKFSIEYAGEFLGGEIDFTKYLAETGIFFPLFWNFTGALHAEGGYLDDRTDDDINIDNVKFYLGGMNSIRGFDKYDINANYPGDVQDRGGEKYVQFNAEITYPFSKEYNVAVVFFYDRGDVYRVGENIDLGDQFSSFGTGIRWNSPMGPIRLEYGWVIDGKNVRERGDGQFEFSVGAFF